jgi:hypothetical protein
MEAIGTYISVVGLGTLFANDPVITTMAVILDVAKIIAVSLLYQYWVHPVIKKLRYYLLPSVIVLMVISSAGTFGYLSGAFQKALAPNMGITLKVDAYNKERDMLIAERADLQKQSAQINEQILKEEDPKRKQNLIWAFRSETKRIARRIPTVSQRIDELNELALKTASENIESNVHAGPITYIAKAFNLSLEDASKYIIGTIVGVFDPLAIIFILAGNFLIRMRREMSNPPPIPEPPASWIVPVTPGDPKPEAILVDKEDKEAERVKSTAGAPVSEKAQKFYDSIALEQALAPKKPATTFKDPKLAKSISSTRRKRVKPIEIIEPVEDTSKPHTIRVESPKLLGPDERALISEEKVLFKNVYDPIDTGEAPEEVEVDVALEDAMIQEVHDYVPVMPPESIVVPELTPSEVQVEPAIDVFAEGTFSGTPQADLIQPRRAILQDPNINKSL